MSYDELPEAPYPALIVIRPSVATHVVITLVLTTIVLILASIVRHPLAWLIGATVVLGVNAAVYAGCVIIITPDHLASLDPGAGMLRLRYRDIRTITYQTVRLLHWFPWERLALQLYTDHQIERYIPITPFRKQEIINLYLLLEDKGIFIERERRRR
jgi:hypothetical protein